MKRIVSFILLFCLIFSITPTSANAFFNSNTTLIEGEEGFETFACGDAVITEEVDKAIDDYKENDANMAEKFIASQAQNFFHIGDINGFSTLIFGNPYCVWNSDSDEKAVMASNGIFTDEEMTKIIDPMVSMLGSLFLMVMTLAFLLSGLKIMVTSVRGNALANFWEDAGMWFFAFFLAVFYYEFINLLFQLNAAFVLSIRDLILAGNDKALEGFSVMSSLSDFVNVGGVGSFLIIVIAEWLLAGVLNVIYIARKVIIILLIFMGVIAIYSLMFAKTRGFFVNWLRELVGNIFLQSIHALVFFMVIQFVSLGAGVFFKLVLMMMFIPVSGMISKWLSFDDSSSKIGTALTMVGLGGAMSSIMLASQARNIVNGGSMYGGSNVFGGANGPTGGGGGGGGGLTQLANSTANDMLATSISARAQSSADTTMFNMAKSAGGNLGQFVGTGAGTVLGPAGVMLGAQVGRSVGEAIPQIGRNIAVAAQSLTSNISAMRSFQGQDGSTGVNAMFGNQSANSFAALEARRASMANIGESIGLALAGQKGAQLGRSAGAAFSGVSRERLNMTNAQELAASAGMGEINGALSFAQLAEKFPNADAKWVQTNQGSSFQVDMGDGFKQVGVTGAADGNLADGQARVMDFKLGDSSLDYALQPNGTYKPDQDAFKAATANAEVANAVEGAASIPTFEAAMGSASTSTDPANVSNFGSANTIEEAASVPTFEAAMGSASTNIDPTNASDFGSANTVTPDNFNASVLTSTNSSPDNGSSGSTVVPFDEAMSGGTVITGSDAGAGMAGSSSSVDLSTPDVTNSANPVEAPSSHVTSNTPAAIGLQGSTPNVMRTSEAYIVSGVDSSNASSVATATTRKEVTKVQDATFQSKSVNPDAYVFQGVKGSPTSTSDRVADSVKATNAVKGHWQEKLKTQLANRNERKRNII